jgi:hypothetical protein
MKKCPKCGRTSPPALAICPRCKTPLNTPAVEKPATHQQFDKTPNGSQPDNSTGKSRKTIIIAGIAAVIVLAAAASSYYFSYEIKRQSRLLTQKLQGKEWKYPPGDADETAQAFSVQQLIDMWETLPPDSSKTALHAVYAKALGRKGKDAVSAIPLLAPYVTDKNLYIRQGAMDGLAGIGEEGLPFLVKALKYNDTEGGDAVTIRWDAAIAIAKMGANAKGAIQDLLAAITDPKENPNVKLDAAVALAGIGSDAVPALNKARCYFYDQGGLSPAETSVLREVNLALHRMNASPEDCKGLSSSQESSAEPSSGTFLSAADLSRMQVPQLLDALRSHPYNTQTIADELAKRGAKTEAAEVLTSMLREGEQKSDLGIKTALRKLGFPVTYDSSRNVFLPISEDNIGYIEWSAEVKGDDVYSSGKIYVGQDVIAGLSRSQQGMVTIPTFVKYTITLKGGSLRQPVEKTFDVNTAGEVLWDNVMLASGIRPGKYSVTLFLHAQFVKEDGTGQILNNNAGFLEVER